MSADDGRVRPAAREFAARVVCLSAFGQRLDVLAARKSGHSRGGVFWQTQGSGKRFSMVFFTQKVLRKVAGNWTFVVVTDRVELDDQIAKTFKATSAGE